tara:strand:+ start:142 stop:297 length:156 start_codon:yes stop_codon:yes gene_type:complete
MARVIAKLLIAGLIGACGVLAFMAQNHDDAALTCVMITAACVLYLTAFKGR